MSPRPAIVFGLACGLAGVLLPLLPASPSPDIPPATVVSWSPSPSPLRQVVSAWAQKGGLQVEVAPPLAELPVSLSLENVPLWEALERTARQVRGQWNVSADGKSLRLLPKGEGQTIAASAGPFRIVVQTVHARLQPSTAHAVCDLDLLVHWEPRYPVYRIDASPSITMAQDERGQSLAAESSRSRQYPPAAASEMFVRLTGVRRQAQRIACLEGVFRVTLAERLLTLRWDTPPREKMVTQTAGPLIFTWKSLRRNPTLQVWEVELEGEYPADHPRFDSYEESKWLRDVQIQWRTAAGRIVRPQGEEIYASGRKVQVACQFPQAIDPLAAGGSLLLTVPAPLREVRIPFRLENIPLP
ncbi:MAG: hypothetical protein WHU94_08175 [Thermogemmata sp.]|uniref:Uncharacterized protein n=1 Tax=Thermogemmata fonticola TaxID=2755323 RepID=A0A7V8VBZ0_9BACT|nr:hypothetical protein [Thermogemmata fonticola]MBA2225214.1 hypothetical protein [Thermogemmata fonticola]